MDRKHTILIVDDTKENIDVLSGLLIDDYNVKFALNGKMALEVAEKFHPDLILLDVMMPKIDGYQTCKLLNENIVTSDIPVIFVTAKVAIADEKKGFEVGAVDYISKPIQPMIVKSRIKTHLEIADREKHLQRLVNDKVKLLNHMNYEIIDILGRASDYKDTETGEHIRRTQEYSYLLAKSYGLSEEKSQLIKKATPMHDLGKIGVPDGILQKKGKLNKEEWEYIMKHPKIGYDIIGNQSSKLLKVAKKIALEHHEKWNGTGYPKKLKGNEISLEGRIVSIVDVFDALTTKRPYKEAWPLEKAFDLIKEESGEHFDPNIVEIFLNLKNEIKEIHQSIMEV
ncbi:MAG TPA: HD domain-containing phosphohydrolase [Clostridia bacterium]|nr:HD domain-containing phosphohydrolase [Clostridia bacterium]